MPSRKRVTKTASPRAASFRAYCRACDRAVDAAPPWPGRCLACGTPVEAAPVDDVVAPGLDVLFVGINPGIQTARNGLHFANPQNAFWPSLAASGFTPHRFEPREQRDLLKIGLGVTNVVSRATPGSADVTREDVERGRARFAALVEEHRPRWVAFVGKQAWQMATGVAGAPLGERPEGFRGARAFVLPSTSPANAGVSREEKARWFAALKKEVDRAGARPAR